MHSKLNESNDNLVKAVVNCRQKLDLCPVGSPSCSRVLGELADALYNRFQQLGEIEDLEEGITFSYQGLELRLPEDPDRCKSLNTLANALHARFNQRGRIEDLEDTITYHRQALNYCPPRHPDRSRSLSNLAMAFRTRFNLRGLTKDLEEALTCHREALDLRPPGHPDRSQSLNTFANVIIIRFNQWGQIEDLEEAIVCYRQSLDLRPPGNPDRIASLTNLAVALLIRFEQWGQIEDLEESITFHRQALDFCPPGFPDRSLVLNNLANTLYHRFRQRGQIADLEEAITCHQQALDLRPPGHPDRLGSLHGLGATKCTRFGLQGRTKDLEEAITHLRQGFDLLPPGYPNRFMSLSNLAGAVLMRFHERAQIEDLEEVVMCYRQALDLLPPGYPNRDLFLYNLADAVFARFNQRGQIEDLEEAIKYHCQALEFLSPGNPKFPMVLEGFAKCVVSRFNQWGQIEDLEEGITYQRQALNLRPPGHPDRFHSLVNLGFTVFLRFKQRGWIEDLEEAITCHREALDLCLPGNPSHSESRKDLASDLSARFRLLGGTEDLEEAIKLLFEAEDNLPDPHPMHAELRSHLATAHLLRHKAHFQPDDCLPQAFRLFESAANHSPATLKDRFDATLEWAQEARRHQHYSTLQAYSISLSLLDRRLSVTPDIESQQHLLATNSSIPRSLASDAASSAIGRGKLETAVELLEQGRANLWSRLRGYRHPIERLRDIDRQLADRFETLSSRLEHLAMSPRSELTLPGPDAEGLTLPPAFDAKMHQHRIYMEEWDNVVQRIRQIEGFTDFLQAVPFATLQLAATEGPVIIVNISKYRSDAIIMHGMDPPVLVPLPGASPESLVLISSQLSDALTKRSLSIPRLLRRLWDTIVLPVRDKLAAIGVGEQSRIWWCPTSELCALPLHAAGPYTHGEKNLPDIYISSYIPTLSTLIKARSGILRQHSLPKLLVMGQPGENLEVGTLQNVKEEIRRIHSFGDFVDVLVAGDANRQTVLPHLQEHNWIHFACHGHQAPQPFQSSFELHDEEQLTLIDLIKARLPNAEFAFLSACHSAAADSGNTPDEVINPAAAVQFCGFRSVVGTLWAMADVDGPDVAEDFYRYMFRNLGSVDFRDSAKALNLATRAMRKRKRMSIDRWINFVHIGA